MSHVNLAWYREKPDVKFTTVACKNKIFVFAQSGMLYRFDQKLQKTGQYNLRGISYTSDGSYLNFTKKTRFGKVCYAAIPIGKFDPETLQNPRLFRNLFDYECDTRGRLNVYFLRFDQILLVNSLEDKMMFTIYNHEKHYCVREFKVNAGKKDYKMKFDMKKALVYPKENRKTQSYLFDFKFMMRKVTKY